LPGRPRRTSPSRKPRTMPPISTPSD
jgi:hypothetical protein